jgi:hypothetical protein
MAQRKADTESTAHDCCAQAAAALPSTSTTQRPNESSTMQNRTCKECMQLHICSTQGAQEPYIQIQKKTTRNIRSESGHQSPSLGFEEQDGPHMCGCSSGVSKNRTASSLCTCFATTWANTATKQSAMPARCHDCPSNTKHRSQFIHQRDVPHCSPAEDASACIPLRQ